MENIADIESGDMTYMPVQVMEEIGVRHSRTTAGISEVSIFTDRSTGMVHIDIGDRDARSVIVAVYSLQGKLLRTLAPAGATASLLWNGTDNFGRPVQAGSYIIRLSDRSGSIVRTIQLIR
jgi:hypothetical protein